MQDTPTLFGLTLHPYGLGIAAAALLQLALMQFFSRRRKLPAGFVLLFGVLAIPFGLFFARLLFCLFNISLFTETYENPWLMLRFFDGGLSMSGLILGIFLAAFATSRILKIAYAPFLDLVTLPLGLFLGICRAAECFTELGAGKIWGEGFLTQYVPWLFLTESAGISTEYRLAVYGYEAVCGILIFLCMLCMARRTQKHPLAQPGDSSLLFMALYGSTQVLWESMRDDGHLLLTFLRVAQVFAFLMPILAALVFSKRHARTRSKMNATLWLAWSVLFLCMASLVLLEFSLDGRFSWGIPSLSRDYILMLIVCALLFFLPYSLWRTVTRPADSTPSKG